MRVKIEVVMFEWKLFCGCVVLGILLDFVFFMVEKEGFLFFWNVFIVKKNKN